MDSRKFRNIAGRFATGVTIITMIGRGNRPVGLTANSFTTLSLNPMLVLFNIDKSSSVFEDFKTTSAFAVNILSAEQEKLAKHFSTKDIDRFEGIDYQTAHTGSPIFSDVIGYFDCEVETRYEGGDHIIVVGRVVDGQEGEGDPLLFVGGQFKYLQE